MLAFLQTTTIFAQEEKCLFQHLGVQNELVLRKGNVLRPKGSYFKSHVSKIVTKFDFCKLGYQYSASTVKHFVNILLPTRVIDTSGYFRIQKSNYAILGFVENDLNVGGWLSYDFWPVHTRAVQI